MSENFVDNETKTVPSPDHSGGPEEPLVPPVVGDGDGVVDGPPPVVPPDNGDGEEDVDGDGDSDEDGDGDSDEDGDGDGSSPDSRPVFDLIPNIPDNETRANLANDYAHCRVKSRDGVRPYIQNQLNEYLSLITADDLFRGPGMGRRTTRSGRFEDAPIAENARRLFTRHLNARPAEPDESPEESDSDISVFEISESDSGTPLR